MIETSKITMEPQRARRAGLILAALVAILLAALLAQNPAYAGDEYTWTGEGNGYTWTDPCNWYEQGACQQKYPGKEAQDDRVVIDAKGDPSPHVSLGENITLASLTLGDNSRLLGGGVAVNERFDWTGGEVGSNLALSPGSIGKIEGKDPKLLTNTISNRGNLSVGPDTNLTDARLLMGAGAAIDNLGALDVTLGSTVVGQACCTNPAEINNLGKLTVSPSVSAPGAHQADFDAVSLNAGGTVEVREGTLELRVAPGEIAAGAGFAGDGRVRITDRSQIEMLGAFTVSPLTELELTSEAKDSGRGVLLGTGTMEGEGRFLWNGGTVSGDLTLGHLTDTFVGGAAEKALTGRITNSGRALLEAGASPDTPTGRLLLGPKAALINGGHFIVDEGTSIVGQVCCGPDIATFESTGYFGVSEDGTPTPGSVSVDALAFRMGGETNVARGALELRRGRGTLLTGAEVTGGGRVRVTDVQVVTMNGALSVAPESTFELASKSGDSGQGVLTGGGTVVGGGLFLWTGGTIDENGYLTIAKGNDLQLEAPAAKYLRGTLRNEGSAALVSDPAPAPAGGPLKFVGAARFLNAGTFQASDRSVLAGTSCCGDPATFVNTGTFTMSPPFNTSAGSVAVNSMLFENRGTVELRTGKLVLGESYGQFSGSTRLTGGSLETEKYAHINGGVLSGTGTIKAFLVQNSAGTIAPGGIGSTGILNIAGNLRQEPEGILKADLAGTTPSRGFDQLRVSGQTILAGTVDIDTARGYKPAKSTRLKILTATKRVGLFDRLTDRKLPDRRTWYAAYGPHDVTLRVR